MARLWLLQVKEGAVAVAAIALAVFATALLITISPRLLEKVSDDDLRESLLQSEPEERNIVIEHQDRIGVGGGSEGAFSQVVSRGEQYLAEDFPPSVVDVVDERSAVIDSPAFLVTTFPDEQIGPFPTSFRFRHQSGLDDRITFVEGAPPDRHRPIEVLQGGQCPDDVTAIEGFTPSPTIDCAVELLQVFETAVTRETADAMRIDVGDMVILAPDLRDRAWLAGHAEELDRRVVLVFAGIIELDPIEDDYWFDDPSLHRPQITENSDFRLIAATGLFHPGDYQEMLRNTFGVLFSHQWRYLVDPDAVAGADPVELGLDAARIAPIDGDVRTRLPAVIDEFLAQRSLVVSLISTGLAGVVIIAVSVVQLVAVLLARRQRRETGLAADRGASRLQLFVGASSTALLVSVPSVVLGVLAARRIVPDVSSLTVEWWAAVFGAAVLLTVTFSTMSPSSRRERDADARPVITSIRTHVRNLTIVVVAGAAIMLLRRRARLDESPEIGDLDVLLAAGPVAIAIAAAVILVYLVPPIVRTVAWWGARQTGAVRFLGFRRLLEQVDQARLPLLVVFLGGAIMVYAVIVGASINDGQNRHAWNAVGADHLVSSAIGGGALPVGVAEAIEGEPFEQLASSVVFDDAVVAEATALRSRLIAVDLHDHIDLWSAPSLPGPDVTPLDSRAPALAIPAIITSALAADQGLAPGDGFDVQLRARSLRLVVRSVIEQFPPLGPGDPAMIVDVDLLTARADDLPTTPTHLSIGGGVDAGPELQRRLDAARIDARVISRAAVLDEIAGDPFAAWVDRGLDLVLAIAIGAAGFAAIAVLTVTAERRSRDLGLLRTLGLRRRQATAITVIEHVVPVVVAALGGGLAGVLVGRLLAANLALDSFAGGTRVELEFEPSIVFGATATFAIGLTLAAVASVAVDGWRNGARIRRVGDE